MFVVKPVASFSKPKQQQVLKRRKTEIKQIRESLSKISESETQRVKKLWEDHLDFFKDDDVDTETLTDTFFISAPDGPKQ
jgi:hypothetical protein